MPKLGQSLAPLTHLVEGWIGQGVTGTLRGFFCPHCMAAPFRRLGRDKHISVCDAVWKSPGSRHGAEQRDAGVGWLCWLLWREGVPSASRSCPRPSALLWGNLTESPRTDAEQSGAGQAQERC